MRWTIVALGTIVSFRTAPAAQAPQPSASPRFEVVSVRQNSGGDSGSRMRVQPGGRFVATNVTLEQLILQAYQIQPFQLTGGPGWIKSDRFDIVATAGAEVPEPNLGSPDRCRT